MSGSAHAHDHPHDPAHAHDHRHAHAHGHRHEHHAEPGDWRYPVAIGLNLAFVALEFGFGLYARSSALIADAGHNLSDVLGLMLAGGAAWLAKKAADRRRTYGWRKATILAALANAVLLIFACGAIAIESAHRLSEPAEVRSGVVMAVAGAGFVLNLATALLFLRGSKEDLNTRGAFLHMAADAGVSLGVVVVGAVVLLTGWTIVDPLASLAIVAIILMGTWGLLRQSLNLAMDAAPEGTDVQAVERWLGELPGVADVHHVHVWALSTTETALTAHLVRAEAADRAFLDAARDGLKKRFGIGHATLQVEIDARYACANC
jgi:cobalt-zinc-cadmium efflux system protein